MKSKNIRQVRMDLFDVPEDYYLAHCISSDFALGRGIAVEFCNRFETKQKLLHTFPGYHEKFINSPSPGDCLIADRVINLITKVYYYNKPTLASMRSALEECKKACLERGIIKIAMPAIGCGLDRLNWNDVYEIICDVFADSGIEILICRK